MARVRLNARASRAVELALGTPRRRRRIKTDKSVVPGPSETKIHIAVADHLAVRAHADVFWFHPANEGERSEREAAKLKRMGMLPGALDFFFVRTGQAYALELKKDDGRLSLAQQACIKALQEAGAITAVAYSLDQALDVLEGWGLLKPDLFGHNAHSRDA